MRQTKNTLQKLKLKSVLLSKSVGGMIWAYRHCTSGQDVTCCNLGDGTGTHCWDANTGEPL